MWRSTSMDSTATGRPRVCILWRGGVSCPVSVAWHFYVAAHWSKDRCYKQATSSYDLRCFTATLNPNKQTNLIRPILSVCFLWPSHEKNAYVAKMWSHLSNNSELRRGGLVVSASASHVVSRGFALTPVHTKDHHKMPPCFARRR